VSKCDLFQNSPVVFITENYNPDHVEMVRYRKLGPDGAIHVSVKSEAGLNEVTVL
jgi:nucleolar GTP-binding protein